MIPRDLIKKLRKIEIRTTKLANDQLAGGYHSVFKGKGMAFSEVRQYQPGDDVRFIDWNVSARMNDTYVKVFSEEREMTVMLLVDLSASERFGSTNQPKVETVAEIAANLEQHMHCSLPQLPSGVCHHLLLVLALACR